MTRLRVHGFAISLDGYGAGPKQDTDNPLGVGGEALHDWRFATRSWHRSVGEDGGETGIDNDFEERGSVNVGAWILGQNMFGPKGSWADPAWKGWWGDTPPYHTSVFVLTHHPREPIHMQGGTTFHFVTDGIRSALTQATEAAQGKDIRLGGGVSTIRQYLMAGLIDELEFSISPIFLGSGEHLFFGIDTLALGYRCTEYVNSARATHVVLTKTEPNQEQRA
jgi:dihydrofolate reductase